MPDAAHVSATTAGGETPTKWYTPLDVRFTFYNPLGTASMTTLDISSTYPINNKTPVSTNNSVEPNEVFKNYANNIIDAIAFIIDHMSYGPKTVLLQMKELIQELNDDDTNYQATVTHPRK